MPDQKTDPGTREPLAAQHPTTTTVEIGERVFTITRPGPRAQLAQKAQLARTLGPGLFGVIFGGVKVGGEQFAVKTAIAMIFSSDKDDPDPAGTEAVKAVVRKSLGPILMTAIGQIAPDEIYSLCDHMLVDCCSVEVDGQRTSLVSDSQLDDTKFVRDDLELYRLVKAAVSLCMVPFAAPSSSSQTKS